MRFKVMCYNFGSMASVAKWSNAPGCGSGDRGFESHRSPHLIVETGFLQVQLISFVSACSSMDRALVFGTRCWGFESLQAYHIISGTIPMNHNKAPNWRAHRGFKKYNSLA
jgi:hypothetical protein